MTTQNRIAEPFQLRTPGAVKKKERDDLGYPSLFIHESVLAAAMAAILFLLSGRAGTFPDCPCPVIRGIEFRAFANHAGECRINNQSSLRNFVVEYGLLVFVHLKRS